MDFVTNMSTSGLIEKVKENREAHKKQYEEAVTAYWEKLDRFVERLQGRVRDRDSQLLVVPRPGTWQLGHQPLADGAPTPPPCYLGEYNKSLAMIEAHQGETVELGEDDFAKLVLDRWDWTENFTNSYNSLTG